MLEPLQPSNNPPLVEAIFGITFKDPVDQERLNLFHNTQYVKERYPRILPGVIVEVSDSADEDRPIKTSHQKDGYQLRSAVEKNRLVQVRATQLTYHNLRKYAGWETMFSELKTLWDEFCKSVGKNDLSQLSVRYINQILIPLPIENFEEYINFSPKMPDGINKKLNNFFLQITVPVIDNVTATVFMARQ